MVIAVMGAGNWVNCNSADWDCVHDGGRGGMLIGVVVAVGI